MKHFSLLLVMALLLFAAPAFAQPAADSEADLMKAQLTEKQQALIDAPTGVFDMEYDDGGALTRFKIKGEAEVPATLKGVRADRQARERAERNAKAAFSKFLNENVVVVESDSETFIIKEKDGTESAEYLSASAKSVNTMSNSFQRGLVTLLDHVQGTGVDRKALVVLGWSKKLTTASMQAQEAMKPQSATPSQSGKDAAREENGPPAGKTQTRSGDIDNF